VGECERDHQGQGLGGEWAGFVRAGASAEPRPLARGALPGAAADARRLSPLPAGRWSLAVTQVSGTVPVRSVRVARPTVPSILSP
jgi:hypothetical protein